MRSPTTCLTRVREETAGLGSDTLASINSESKSMLDTPSKTFVVIGADGRTEITVAGENVSYGEHGISVTDINGRAVGFFPYENLLGFHAQGAAKVVRY